MAAVSSMAPVLGPDPSVPLLARLCCQFPHVDSEVVAAVLESVGGTVVEALGVLCDLQSEAQAQPPASAPERVPLELRANGDLLDLGSVGEAGQAVLQVAVDPALLAVGDSAASPPSLLLAVPSGELWPLAWHEPPLTLRPPSHGWYRLILQAPGGRTEARFHVASAVGEYAEALDDFHDALAWAWDGAKWTEELGEASLNLLVGMDEFMERLGAMLKPVLPMMGGSFKSMLESPRKVLENHLARIIEQRDAQAVGMTHTSVRDLLQQSDALSMFGPLLGGASAGGSSEAVANFSAAAAAWEKARQSACDEAHRSQLAKALSRLLLAGDRYVAFLRSPKAASSSGANNGLAKQWDIPNGIRSQLQAVLDEDGTVPLSVVMQLQGAGGGFLADMLGQLASASNVSSGQGPPTVAESMSFLDSEALLAGGRELMFRVARWSESLVSGTVVIGSPMRPMQLSGTPGEVQQSAQALMQLLRLGFGYVVQSDDASGGAPTGRECTLAGMLHRTRATLPLRAQEAFLADRKRKSRLKDVMRVVRSQAKSGRKFSLRLNTDLDLAVTMLREHHEDNWVGPILELVWGEMLKSGTLVVFELWAVEEDGTEQLIAADFGHPHSTFGFYVATRYFDRAFRTCMPGFILAFAEAQVLARYGYDFWDLGGTNQSPMMQYKPQVAIEMRKDVFLDELHATHRHELVSAGKEPERLVAGTVVEALTEDDLWGAALCREAIAQPAKKQPGDASKKQQSQPKKGKTPKPAAPTGAKAAASPPEGDSSQPQPAAATPAVPTEASPEPVAASPEAAEPAAVAPSNLVDMKAQLNRRLQELHKELCASGMSQKDAAVEALKRLRLEGS